MGYLKALQIWIGNQARAVRLVVEGGLGATVIACWLGVWLAPGDAMIIAPVLVFGTVLGCLGLATAPNLRGKWKAIWAVVLTLISIGLYWHNENVAGDVDEKLPGIAVESVINIQDVTAMRRKYVFELSTPENAKAAFYLSASDVFTFVVTDVHGETYPLEIPLGRNGVPFERWMVLICEAGSGSNYSVLRATINGKEFHQDFPTRIDLGSRQWSPTIGATKAGQFNGAFLLAELGISPVTFSRDESQKLTQNALNYYHPNGT